MHGLGPTPDREVMELEERRLSLRPARRLEPPIYPPIITLIPKGDIQEDTATPRTWSTHLHQACITVGDMVAMEEVIFNERGEKKLEDLSWGIVG